MHISAFIVYDTRIYIQQSLHLYIHNSFVPFNFRSLLGVVVFIMFLSVLFWFVFVNLLAVDDAAAAAVAVVEQSTPHLILCARCALMYVVVVSVHVHMCIRYDTIRYVFVVFCIVFFLCILYSSSWFCWLVYLRAFSIITLWSRKHAAAVVKTLSVICLSGRKKSGHKYNTAQ